MVVIRHILIVGKCPYRVGKLTVGVAEVAVRGSRILLRLAGVCPHSGAHWGDKQNVIICGALVILTNVSLLPACDDY